MPGDNIGVLVKIQRKKIAVGRLKKQRGAGFFILIRNNPGPFPLGFPPDISAIQYAGIHEHLVLTMLFEGDIGGLIPLAADLPLDPEHGQIVWIGAAACGLDGMTLRYAMSPEFLRDEGLVFREHKTFQVMARLVEMTGAVTGRGYWTFQIPTLSRNVLMDIDEIVIIRKRRQMLRRAGTKLRAGLIGTP